MPLKRATESASRAGGAIERFIVLGVAVRLDDLLADIRALRSEMQNVGKPLCENISPLRYEMQAEIHSVRTEVEATRMQLNTRIDTLGQQVNTRIDALSQRLDDALDVRERLVAVEAKLAARGS